ncbi:hypothetical protein PF003_g27770 [Phytophthora fragariae]|nr:hypothetical protein PF003_g27770 [Phytophthora fragariae]
MLMLSSMKTAVSLLIAVIEWRVVAADGEGYIVAATVSKVAVLLLMLSS